MHKRRFDGYVSIVPTIAQASNRLLNKRWIDDFTSVKSRVVLILFKKSLRLLDIPSVPRFWFWLTSTEILIYSAYRISLDIIIRCACRSNIWSRDINSISRYYSICRSNIRSLNSKSICRLNIRPRGSNSIYRSNIRFRVTNSNYRWNSICLMFFL